MRLVELSSAARLAAAWGPSCAAWMMTVASNASGTRLVPAVVLALVPQLLDPLVGTGGG